MHVTYTLRAKVLNVGDMHYFFNVVHKSKDFRINIQL